MKEIPEQVIVTLHGMSFILRLSVTEYKSPVEGFSFFSSSYNQLNDKGEEVHSYCFGRGKTEEEAKESVYKEFLRIQDERKNKKV